MNYEQYVMIGNVNKITSAELYNNYTTMMNTWTKSEDVSKNSC